MCGQLTAYNTYATLSYTKPLFLGFFCYQNVNKEIISLIGVYIKDFIPEAWLPGFFCIFISDYSFPMGCKDVLILRHSWNSYYEHLPYN